LFFRERLLYGYRDLPLEAYILYFYKNIVGLYLNYSLFEWPEKIKDQEMLNMLSAEFLSLIQEIQMKIVDIFNAMYPEDQGKRDYGALRAPTELDAEHLHIIFEAYYRMGLGKQVEEVIDSLWKLGLPFVPSEPLVDELAEVERSGDWRKIVKEWKYIKEKSPPKFKVQF
jgi:hypothetical protein